MTTIYVPEDYTISAMIEEILMKNGKFYCTGSDCYFSDQKVKQDVILSQLAEEFVKLFRFEENED